MDLAPRRSFPPLKLPNRSWNLSRRPDGEEAIAVEDAVRRRRVDREHDRNLQPLRNREGAALVADEEPAPRDDFREGEEVLGRRERDRPDVALERAPLGPLQSRRR